jgi:hypothetical protein
MNLSGISDKWTYINQQNRYKWIQMNAKWILNEHKMNANERKWTQMNENERKWTKMNEMNEIDWK